MRPKPLIPIRVATLLTPELCSAKDGYDDSVSEDIWALLDVGEHLRSQVGLGVGDAEILGALVRHREQPADPPGRGGLGGGGGGRGRRAPPGRLVRAGAAAGRPTAGARARRRRGSPVLGRR